MKILYLDFLYPKGHIRLDYNNIRCLSRIGEVYVVSPKGRYSNLPEDVKLIEKKFICIRKGRLLNRLSSLKAMIISANIIRETKPDCVLIASYDTVIFSIGRFFFKRKNRIILFQHNNVDELTNIYKKILFKSYMNHVEHIVFEDFIRKHLINTYNIDAKRVYAVPHHIMNDKKQTENKVLNHFCVGLSNSNDEKIIEEIIKIETEKEILKKLGCKVLLKSKKMKFDNGFLKVIQGFLEEEEFKEYINECKCMYMPFPNTFKYRISGSLIDALANNKIVFGSNIPLFNHYNYRYPSICTIVISAQDFFENITKLYKKPNDISFDQYTRFRNDHSEVKIISLFEKIIENNKDKHTI